MGDESLTEEEFRFHTVGEKLKAERERLGLTLSDIAAKTRIPMRHLEAIEKSDFSSLPGTTYTLGFTRSYARALDMDAATLSDDMRAELAVGGHESYRPPTQNYEPADPSRVPSRTLAWTAAAIGIIVVAAYFAWRSMALMDTPVAPVTVVTTASQDISAPVDNPATNSRSIVVITATDDVWVKIYDADNKRLFESEMEAGDKFTVPSDANNPMIVTGRPNLLDITVDGKAVPSLGEPDKTIVDVGVSARALLDRRMGPASGAEGDRPER